MMNHKLFFLFVSFFNIFSNNKAKGVIYDNIYCLSFDGFRVNKLALDWTLAI